MTHSGCQNRQKARTGIFVKSGNQYQMRRTYDLKAFEKIFEKLPAVRPHTQGIYSQHEPP